MNRSRRWILGCAMGCFAAGLSAGLVMPAVVAACCGATETNDPNEDYVEWMTARLGLTSRQRQMLRVVLDRSAQEEFEVFQKASIDQLPDSMRIDLQAARRRQTARVRQLLTDEQRVRFDKEDPSRQLGEVK